MPKSRRRKFAAKRPSPKAPAPAPQAAPPTAARPTPSQQPVAAAVRKPVAVKATVPPHAQYPYVSRDLVRVCVVSAIVVAVLIVFAIVLP